MLSSTSSGTPTVVRLGSSLGIFTVGSGGARQLELPGADALDQWPQGRMPQLSGHTLPWDMVLPAALAIELSEQGLAEVFLCDPSCPFTSMGHTS